MLLWNVKTIKGRQQQRAELHCTSVLAVAGRSVVAPLHRAASLSRALAFRSASRAAFFTLRSAAFSDLASTALSMRATTPCTSLLTGGVAGPRFLAGAAEVLRNKPSLYLCLHMAYDAYTLQDHARRISSEERLPCCRYVEAPFHASKLSGSREVALATLGQVSLGDACWRRNGTRCRQKGCRERPACLRG